MATCAPCNPVRPERGQLDLDGPSWAMILGQHSDMFECGIGEFALERYPRRANEALQAWDAADKLILRRLEEHHESTGDVLVVNDAWGALSTALAHRRPST